jgi:hypothetical protein
LLGTAARNCYGFADLHFGVFSKLQVSREGEGEEGGKRWFLSLNDKWKILIFRKRFPVSLTVLIQIT